MLGEHDESLQAAAEGAMLASFDPMPYKTGPKDGTTLHEVLLLKGARDATDDDCDRAVARGVRLGECCNLARELTNEPANRLTPGVLAERAQEIGAVDGLHVRVLDERAIELLGMRLLLGVAAGSRELPRLIVLEYTPAGVRRGPLRAHREGRDLRRGRTLGRTRPLAREHEGRHGRRRGGDLRDAGDRAAKRADPCDRSRPSRREHARPRSAETGRRSARRERDDGGNRQHGCRGTPAPRRRSLVRATARRDAPRGHSDVDQCVCNGIGRIHERVVRDADGVARNGSGLRRSLRRSLLASADVRGVLAAARSDIADISNTGGPAAGAITAALFLRAFSGGLPWAHLDIAGTAWSYEPRKGQPKGPTGVGGPNARHARASGTHMGGLLRIGPVGRVTIPVAPHRAR